MFWALDEAANIVMIAAWSDLYGMVEADQVPARRSRWVPPHAADHHRPR